MSSRHLLLFSSGSTRPAPKPRSPLVKPICNSCPGPYSYDQSLGMIPKSDPKYLRMDAWGIPVLNLPFIWGGSSVHPERFISYLWNRYPPQYQQQWLNECALRGYNRALLSWPDARQSGPGVTGQTLQQFVRDIASIREYGLFVKVMLGSKDWDPHDQTLSYWQPLLDPVFDALKGLVDDYGFWEYDLWNLNNQPAVDIWNYLADKAHAQNAKCFCHFSSGKGFWDDRGYQWWYENVRVDGLDYQSDPSYDVGQMQARMADHLRDIGPTGKILRLFEPGVPSLEFDGNITEDQANAYVFAGLCTSTGVPVFPWGFGAGARYWDGSVI